jgi:hypothetical protein
MKRTRSSRDLTSSGSMHTSSRLCVDKKDSLQLSRRAGGGAAARARRPRTAWQRGARLGVAAALGVLTVAARRPDSAAGFELVGTSALSHRGATARAPRRSPDAIPDRGLANTARGAIIGSCRSGRVGQQRFEGGVRHDRAQCRAGGVADRRRARVGDQASRARKPLDGDARRRPRRGAR